MRKKELRARMWVEICRRAQSGDDFRKGDVGKIITGSIDRDKGTCAVESETGATDLFWHDELKRAKSS